MVDPEINKIYILDFGVARLDLTEGAGLTKTGMQIGSVPYMSPEQIAGVKNIDYRTDIYALGLILYEMMAGKPVYDAKTENSLLLPSKIVKEPVPVIDLMEVEKAGINAVISKATAKEPQDRFQSCEDFKQALLDSDPSTFRPVKQKNPVKGDAKEQPKRPVFLSVLCILTYIGSGLWILIWSFSTMSTLAYFFYYFEPVFVILFAVMYIGIIGLGVLSLIGAIKMWQLKKVGFKLYMASWIIPLSLIFIATAFNISTGARIDDSQFMLYGTTYLIGFTFMLMYGTMKKYLVR